MRKLTLAIGLVYLSFALMVAPSAGAQNAGNAPPPSPCPTEPVYSQFDFWIGTWDVRLPNGDPAGSNTIERSEDGCLLTEHWTSTRGGTGTSINYVDPAEGAWKQVWVDARGNVIYLAGALVDGAMKLSGELINAQGNRTSLRGTWTPLEDGRVRQHFESSSDKGATWSTWFDGYYTKVDS